MSISQMLEMIKTQRDQERAVACEQVMKYLMDNLNNDINIARVIFEYVFKKDTINKWKMGDELDDYRLPPLTSWMEVAN